MKLKTLYLVSKIGYYVSIIMDILNELIKKLEEIKVFFKTEVSSIRGSRPTPALVEDITVEYYGQKLPIKQMGSISVVLPREIQITVWDASAVNAIAKAVSTTLNLSASPDGNTVHVNLPSLTQERKDELIKMIKAKTEDTRIKSRNARDDIKKKMGDQEKEGGITEDERFKISQDFQKEIDKFNKEIDEILEKKITEISE